MGRHVRLQLTEKHTETIGFSPSNTTDASRPKTIETQLERFWKLPCSRETKTRTVARHVANCAIN